LTDNVVLGVLAQLQPHSIVDNTNTKAYMASIKQSCMEHLRAMEHAPGVQMQEIPPDHFLPDYDAEEEYEEEDPEQRLSERERDRMVVRDNEYYGDVATRL
jgi:histone deacetylase 1/2